MSLMTATTATWATFPIRLALGSIMFAHGAQKIFGIWGGRGLDAWMDGRAPLDLHPSWFWLGAMAFSEFIGGALVLLGLFTRAAAFFIACRVAIAIFAVHWRNGFFLSENGYEYALALLCMALTLVIMGGGNVSVDSRMAK